MLQNGIAKTGNKNKPKQGMKISQNREFMLQVTENVLYLHFQMTNNNGRQKISE